MTRATTTAAFPAAKTAQSVSAKVSVAGALAQAWRAVTNRFALRPLLEMDDRMLKDIGLARGDVHDALSLGLASDPSSRLAHAARSHLAAEQARLRADLRSDALVKASNPIRSVEAFQRRDIAA